MTVVAALVSGLDSQLRVPEDLHTYRELLPTDLPSENHMLTRRWRSVYVVGPAHQSEFHALRSPASHLHSIFQTARPRSEVAAAPFLLIYFGAIPKVLVSLDNFSGRAEAQLLVVALCSALDNLCERWQMRNSNAGQGEWM